MLKFLIKKLGFAICFVFFFMLVHKHFFFYLKYPKLVLGIISIFNILLISIIFVINIKNKIENEQILQENYEELTAIHEELTATEEELRAQYEELQNSEECLRISEERYKLALEGANDAIWEWNIENNSFFASDKWEEITEYGFNKNDSLKKLLGELLPIENKELLLSQLGDHLSGKTPFYQCEFKLKTKSGKDKWLFIRGKALINSNGEATKLAGSITDITYRKTAEEMNKYLAYYDSLTALPNRAMFVNKLNEALNSCDENGEKGAILFIDLDNFKKVNDILGHQYGDKLLQYVANTLKTVVGESNTVCRLGGDEFLIIQHNIKTENDIIEICENIISAFKHPFKVDKKVIFTSVSIGISQYPQEGTNPNSLLKNADTAMYRAKDSGKNRYEFYNTRMFNEVLRKSELEKGLRTALENTELELYYQPQIHCKTRKIVAMEALLRWKSKDNGFVSPVEFIPIAESSSLIIPIGQWILETACKQNKQWLDNGYDFGTISVNVSVVQLQHPDFIKMVEKALVESNLPAELLELEITESVLMQSLQSNIAILEKLKKLGVSIALDDFGTGYSSLNYLRLLPINVLKIDKSFIDRIHLNSRDSSVVDGIIQLSHKMDLSVVAEGIELEDQFEILRSMNCEKAQGYLFSKPVPAEYIENVVYLIN